jgi:hypothetical protein
LGLATLKLAACADSLDGAPTSNRPADEMRANVSDVLWERQGPRRPDAA